jgi:uncharacterized protein (DUF1330 family)
MTAYAIAQVRILDPVRYRQYQTAVSPVVTKFGGRFLSRGGRQEILEGDDLFNRLVLLEFPDYELAVAFFKSAEYAEAKRHRVGSAEFRFCVVDGGAPPIL